MNEDSGSLLASYAVTQDTTCATEGFQGRSFSLHINKAYCSGQLIAYITANIIYDESLKAPFPASVTLNTFVFTRDFFRIEPSSVMFFIFLVRLPSPCPPPSFSSSIGTGKYSLVVLSLQLLELTTFSFQAVNLYCMAQVVSSILFLYFSRKHWAAKDQSMYEPEVKQKFIEPGIAGGVTFYLLVLILYHELGFLPTIICS